MSVVSYDSKKIIPAPQMSISKQFDTQEDGTIIGNTYTITLNGVLLAYKGSPNSSRVFWDQSGYPPDESIESDSRLGALLRKEEALRQLFSAHGRELYVQSADATEPMKCNPRVINIQFAEGPWFNTIAYTITLEADKIYPIVENVFDSPIKSFSEEWTIETDEATPEGIDLPRTYRLNHNVSAVGKLFYDELGNVGPAWYNARIAVLPRLGLNTSFLLSSGVSDLPSYYGGYNHVRTENINSAGGGYSITETWILTSGSAIEDFTIQITNNAESNRNNVKINGTITGLEIRNADMSLSTTKFANAELKFSEASGLAFNRCLQYGGYNDLNLFPLSDTVGKNPIAGVITYDFEYDNRPYNLIPGAIAERITISDNLPTEIVAVIPVLGRTVGPVLQPINTSQELTRILSVEFTLRSKVDFTDLVAAFNTAKPTALVDTIKTAADPTNIDGYDESYVQTDRETWEPITGKYSREITWIYQ